MFSSLFVLQAVLSVSVSSNYVEDGHIDWLQKAEASINRAQVDVFQAGRQLAKQIDKFHQLREDDFAAPDLSRFVTSLYVKCCSSCSFQTAIEESCRCCIQPPSCSDSEVDLVLLPESEVNQAEVKAGQVVKYVVGSLIYALESLNNNRQMVEALTGEDRSYQARFFLPEARCCPGFLCKFGFIENFFVCQCCDKEDAEDNVIEDKKKEEDNKKEDNKKKDNKKEKEDTVVEKDTFLDTLVSLKKEVLGDKKELLLELLGKVPDTGTTAMPPNLEQI